jgi:hypothetical protein
MADLDLPLTIDAKRGRVQFAIDGSSSDEVLKDLIYAIKDGKNMSEIMRLIDQLGDIDGIYDYGTSYIPKTAFWAAADAGNVRVASILVEHGVDINKTPTLKDHFLHVHSPFVQAVIKGHMPFVKFMLEQEDLKDYSEELQFAIQNMEVPIENLTFARYILTRIKSLAVEKRRLNVQPDVQPDIQPDIGLDEVEDDIVTSVKNGEIDKVVEWLSEGNSPDYRSTNPDDHNQTLLMLAARYEQSPLINLLVRNGADLRLEDNNGRTALELARTLSNGGPYVRLSVYTGFTKKIPRIEYYMHEGDSFKHALSKVVPQLRIQDIEYFRKKYNETVN